MHHERSDGMKAATGPTHGGRPSHFRRVLLLLNGLLGDYTPGLGSLRTKLFATNPTITFDCALLTSPRLMCSMKEYVEQRCSCEEADTPRALEAYAGGLAEAGCKVVHTDLRDNAVKHCDFYNNINSCYGWCASLASRSCVSSSASSAVQHPGARYASCPISITHPLMSGPSNTSRPT